MRFFRTVALALTLAVGIGSTQAQTADEIVNQSIAKHGGELYEQRTLNFTFRTHQYSGWHHADGAYQYQRTTTKGEDKVVSTLNNAGFVQTKNGSQVSLDKKTERGLSNAVNSVFYFALLPYKLNDAAVHKKLRGETTIKGIKYWVVQVSFSEEGGGDDHDDQFMYWFNQETSTMDYLAYSYHVNKGGVRFREAVNSRKVNGIVLQDYINYKAELGTDLTQLPELFEAGKLKELSKILLENESVTTK